MSDARLLRMLAQKSKTQRPRLTSPARIASRAMARPIDYSKWDNLDSSSDDDAQPPVQDAASARAAHLAALEARLTPAQQEVKEYECTRPKRLRGELESAMASLPPGGPAALSPESRFELLRSPALAALAAVRRYLPVRCLCDMRSPGGALLAQCVWRCNA